MLNNFNFNPINGLMDKNEYPSNPVSEDAARGQIMSPLNQLKDFANNVIVNEINKCTGTAEATGEHTLLGGLIVKWGTFKGSGDVVFTKPFPNNCLIVLASPMVAHTSQPPYAVLSGITGGWDKTKFTSVTYGYDIVGANGDTLQNLSYKNTVSSANFQGVSRWIAIGF